MRSHYSCKCLHIVFDLEEIRTLIVVGAVAGDIARAAGAASALPGRHVLRGEILAQITVHTIKKRTGIECQGFQVFAQPLTAEVRALEQKGSSQVAQADGFRMRGGLSEIKRAPEDSAQVQAE